jgi:hypothetical protein
VAEVRRMEPDLLAGLFIARSGLADSDISMACQQDPYALGGRLIQILNDLDGDKRIEELVTHWIDVAAKAPLKPISLDMFRKRIARSSSRRVVEIAAEAAGRVTAALKTGADTAATLLVGPTHRDNEIARSLLEEARALISHGKHNIALEKINESKGLYHSDVLRYRVQHEMRRITLEVECTNALKDIDHLARSLDEGMQLCDEAIIANIYTPDIELSKITRRFMNKFDIYGPNVLTPRGVEFVISSFSIRDIRINRANFILQRISAGGYPQVKVITSVNQCDHVLRGWKYKYFLGLELFYEEKYLAFSGADNDEYARVFKSAQRGVERIRRGFRGDALQLLLALQKFVIDAYSKDQIAWRRVALERSLASFNFALGQQVEMRARHLIELTFCLLITDRSEIQQELYSEALGAAIELGETGQLPQIRRASRAQSTCSGCQRRRQRTKHVSYTEFEFLFPSPR